MRTKVRLKNKDQRYGEYKKDEVGYIDGYCRGGDGAPYAVVIINDRIIMCKTHELEVIELLKDTPDFI